MNRILLWGIGGFALGLFLVQAMHNVAHGADLLISKKPPELCLQPGGKSWAGQVLKADATCASGMRWVFPK